jgi:hypothetical protein
VLLEEVGDEFVREAARLAVAQKHAGFELEDFHRTI